MNCYPVPTIVAKVTKHAWRPIRRAVRHHAHVAWSGVAIGCVGTGAKLWQMLPPTLAVPFPTPTAVPVSVPEPATLALLGIGFVAIALIKWVK